MNYENLSLYNQWLDYQKKSLAKVINIDTEDKEKISFLYFEYFLRVLPKFKYNVYLSKELLENPLYTKYKEVINTIKTNAENSISLKPYLSKGIKNIAKSDAMLNDWGVLHFHLGKELKNDFIKRTGDLLFVYRDVKLKPNELYFLDIFNHNSWSKKRTIEILHNNWGNIIKHYKVEVLVDIEPKLNDEEHLLLRNENVNSAISLSDGTAYIMLGGGITTAGTNQEATMMKINYMKKFRDLELNILEKYKIKKEHLILKINDDKAYVYLDIPYLAENKKIIMLNDIHRL